MTAGHHIDNHPQMHSSFRWSVPKHFNIAEVCSRRWAASPVHASHTAVLQHHADPLMQKQHTYAQLQSAADAFSHVLFEQGVKPGDRVAVVLPQRFDSKAATAAATQQASS